MSCFIVDHAHIDALIDIASQYGNSNTLPRLKEAYDDNSLGKLLLKENLKSYHHRYKDSPHILAESLDEMIAGENYRYIGTGHKFTPREALQVLDCYRYQLAEYEDWDETPVASFILRLREMVIDRAIPPLKEHLWSWTKRKKVAA